MKTGVWNRSLGVCLALMISGGLLPFAQAAPSSLQQQAAELRPYQLKPRVFVLTDIGNEPDDQMSLTRFLLYANELNIEGLVAVTSTWQRTMVHQDMVELVLHHYGEVQKNLLKHSPDYPSWATLKEVVAAGQPGYGMAAVGEGKSSPGSTLLFHAIEKSTMTKPLYISVWGGANTLAQALSDLQKKYGPEAMTSLCRSLVVYSISDQDDAGYWIREHFPAITYIVDPSSQDAMDYARATWTGISGDKYYRNATGADFTTVSQSWLDQHIRSKGPMGKGYLHYAFIMEGDTPSFLSLLKNGLNSYRNPGWGGWGGRYILRQPQNEPHPIWTSGGDCFPGNPNAADTVIGVDGKQYTSNQATIWRWREAFQHDFAARMDWTIRDYKDANHNPIAVVNGIKGTDNIAISAKVGQQLVLDATGSSDPDNNQLTYKWFTYPEAVAAISHAVRPDQVTGKRGEDYLSTEEVLKLVDTEDKQVSVMPLKTGVEHIILAVTDDGSPSLTSYRRIIVTVTE